MFATEVWSKREHPRAALQNLCAAYELFVSINQIKGKMGMCSVKKYGPLIFKFVYGDREGCCADWSELLKRVIRDTACNLNKCKLHNNKDRRIRWKKPQEHIHVV